jgi:hypothetical protein
MTLALEQNSYPGVFDRDPIVSSSCSECQPTRIVTSPACVNLIALLTRLVRTERSRVGSPRNVVATPRQ